MMRTLHVIDQAGDVAQAAVLRLSFDVAQRDRVNQGGGHAWLLFGGEVLRDAARGIGLRDDQFQLLPKPTGLHKILPAALAKPRKIMAQAHRVVCWTEGASQIASLMGCAHAVRRINDATLCPLAREVIAQAHGGVVATQPHDRQSLRQRWGVNEQTKVVALLGDHFDQIDMRATIMTMAFTYEALRSAQPEASEVRLLCHPLTQRRTEASLSSELLHLDQLLIQDSQIAMPWSVLPGCDVALVPCPTAAGLSMLWAEAMGVPIVTPRDAKQPLLDDLQQVVLSRSNKPKDLADALTNWAQSQVSDAACS